ncbi:uncharacterized protein LOC143769229 isoform X2 [Ranitomeya variabilis]|uniref:uncharacterized protein LOC143769229 isoform X2 n=1 Tax=Ranitomeya variabilis TaxID=490064 RepID=UPI0040575C7F
MGDHRHADIVVTRRLWEQVCQQLVDNWEDLDARAQNQALLRRENCQAVAVNQGSLQEGVEQRCGPRVDLVDAGASRSMQGPCRSSDQRWGAKVPSAALGILQS